MVPIGGAEIIGNPKAKMISFGPGNPSTASFKNIALKPREYTMCSTMACLMWLHHSWQIFTGSEKCYQSVIVPSSTINNHCR